jgi:hypothetical protein
MPLAREVVHDLAVEHGACIRPVQLRRTNLDTGEIEQVLVSCGHTLASVCPSCAERARALRASPCREGWHLETEPVMDPDPATEDQRWWIGQRAEAQRLRDQAEAAGEDTGDLDELLAELDGEITRAGMRGKVLPARPARRHDWNIALYRFRSGCPGAGHHGGARSLGNWRDDEHLREVSGIASDGRCLPGSVAMQAA